MANEILYGIQRCALGQVANKKFCYRKRRCVRQNVVKCWDNSIGQEAQLSPSDRAMRLVSSNIANYHATVQKLLIRQVLTKSMV